MAEYKPRIAFDFDGVINSYRSGWCGVDSIPDKPVAGIRKAIEELRQSGYEVVVFSSRADTYAGQSAIRSYLAAWGIRVDEITAKKPACIVCVDDRAICFDGDASTLVEKIKAFRPWHEMGSKIAIPCAEVNCYYNDSKGSCECSRASRDPWLGTACPCYALD